MVRPSLLLFSVSLVFLSLVYFAESHTNLISVNGNRGCVRSSPIADSPRKSADDGAIKCNGNNNPANPCSVAAGSRVTLKWFHGGTGCIDPSHHGPITVWLSGDGGNTFSKIWHDGFRNGGSSGRPGTWATDVMISNGCSVSVTIPNVRAGRYILRTELVAHHESNRQGGAQYYVGCADLQITGGGSCNLSPRLPIPGHIKGPSDPSVFVDIYGGPGKLSNYRPPGGAVATCNGGGGGGGGGAPAPAPRPGPKPGPKPAPRPGNNNKGRCTNNNPPPGSNFSCAQQRGWGKCNESWMRGYCCSTCRN